MQQEETELHTLCVQKYVFFIVLASLVPVNGNLNATAYKDILLQLSQVYLIYIVPNFLTIVCFSQFGAKEPDWPVLHV